MFLECFSPYSEWSERSRKLNKSSMNCMVVNTGSTAGYKAFDYSLWKCECMNLGHQPQPLYYDFEMLKKYSDHIKENANVFICIEHFKFYLDFYEDEKSDYKYYYWLDKDQILTYNHKTDWLIHHVPFLLQPKTTYRVIKCKIKNKLFKEKIKKENEYTEAQDIQYSQQWVDLWNKEFGWDNGQIVRKEQLDTIDIIEKRLLNIIDYCYEHKWTPYIIILPLSPNLSCLLSESVMNPGLWEPLDRVGKLRNINIVDLYNDRRFANWELYENALVLNKKGRVLFNSIVQNEILHRKYD